MEGHNPANERIKRRYFAFLKEAKRHSEPTVDAAAKALNRFEGYNNYRDFKAFHLSRPLPLRSTLPNRKVSILERS
jgi:integrase/recombinase XerD